MLKSDEQTQPAETGGSPKPAFALGATAEKPTGEGGGRRLPSPDRHPSVTPLDLRQAKFNSAMRGFDRAEVSAFLLEAADGYEQALRDNDRLRQDVARLESSLAHYRDLESSIKNTLVTATQTAESVRESAQRAADDTRQHGEREAVRIIREAQGHADLLMQKTQARVEDVQRDIEGLRLKRREAESNLEAIIAAMQTTVAFIREQEQREPSKAAAHNLQVVRAAI
jgi:cell division initiation protein